MRYDVVVVGNGPSGCTAAEICARKHDTAIVGGGTRRIQCAGLISKTGMDKIGVKPGDFVLNTVRGAKMYSPGGVEVVVDGGRPMAYAVDRLEFDQRMLDAAMSSGARYVDGWVESLDGGVALSSGSVMEADRVVLASGTNYGLHMRHRIDRPMEFLVGGQYEMDVECDREFVELYFTVPDFFAWVIPLHDRARVGLCVKGNPRPHLEQFIKRLRRDGRVTSERIYAETFGIIPVHNPSMRTQFGRTVTLGDAAGQVKASTGGGIIFGCVAAKYADSPDYERLWRREIGFDLKLHLLIHRFINRLSDKGKDRFFTAVREGSQALKNGGDMDYAQKTISSLATDPRFLLKIVPQIPTILADLTQLI